MRWITEQLGTAAAADAIAGDVITVDVRHLVDKHGNSVADLRKVIDEGVRLIQDGRKVVVCCDYGISRSNAIAAAILACASGTPFDTALATVMLATGEREIKVDVLAQVRTALGEEQASVAPAPRILVTGGSGFVGRAVLRELQGQCEVLAPPRGELDLAAGAAALDLLVRQHHISHIIHLANPRVVTNSAALGETLVFLRNVLEVCKHNHLRLIFRSGWEIYSGYHSDHLLADERLPVFVKGPEGETKMLCESLIDHYCRLYSLECALLRSSPVYGGSGDRPKFICNFIEKALIGEPITTHRYRNGEPRLDLLHVDDFARAVVAVVNTGFHGTLNLGSGEMVGTRQIAEWIVREIRSGSAVDSRDIEDYTANVVMDISKAFNQISWSPRIDWRSGLQRLVSARTTREQSR